MNQIFQNQDKKSYLFGIMTAARYVLKRNQNEIMSSIEKSTENTNKQIKIVVLCIGEFFLGEKVKQSSKSHAL